MKVLLAFTLAFSALAADPRGVTPDDYFAIANVGDPQFSPDGKLIAYTVTRADAKDNRRTSEIWTVPIDGSAPPRRITTGASSSAPRWTPDGHSLAFLSARLGAGETTARPQVYLLPLDGGEARRITKLPNGVSAFAWSPDGKRLVCVSRSGPATTDRPTDTRHYFSSSYKFNGRSFFDSMRTHLWVSDAQTMEARQITSGDQRNDADPQWSPDGSRIAFASQRTDAEPGPVDDIWVVPAAGGTPLQIADHHEDDHAPRWSPDGTKFQRGVNLEWGGKAYTDIMNGVDAVLAKNDWIDRDRLGVTGGSWGGFMTNWIVGHTDRFKAAVTLRSISNFTSVEGTRDAAYGHKRDFGGDLYQNFDLYWKYSPVRYAKDVKTPTLVLHSDDDQRVPLEQGEQWFRALQHFHVPSEFVIFPRENHDLTRNGEPKHLVESLNWQIYWFDRYLNGNANATPPDAAR